MATIATRIQHVRARIAAACERAGRPQGAVTLLAVSKWQPAQAVRQACEAGVSSVGENYVQEALDKMAQLTDLSLQWHLIGPLQRNKTRVVAQHFDWVHTVDRLAVAQRLSEQRPDRLPPLDVCLQVNVSGEDSKHGVVPEDLEALAVSVSSLPRLRLRGLMSIPAPQEGEDAQRQPHRVLRGLFDGLRARGLALDTLSMGMSHDLEAAILEGATVVRVGTALFGLREAPART